jgi:hypothetical protein
MVKTQRRPRADNEWCRWPKETIDVSRQEENCRSAKAEMGEGQSNPEEVCLKDKTSFSPQIKPAF